MICTYFSLSLCPCTVKKPHRLYRRRLDIRNHRKTLTEIYTIHNGFEYFGRITVQINYRLHVRVLEEEPNNSTEQISKFLKTYSDMCRCLTLLHKRETDRERLICLTSPDPPKAAACRKKHASADQWASPLGRTKNRNIEKKRKTNSG